MFRASFLISAAVFIGLFTGLVVGQSADQRARDLVSSLDKTKYKKKDKPNVSIEIYIDVRNEPAVRADKSEYTGIYESDGYQLMLTVNKDGSAAGTGYDTFAGDGKKLSFSLQDARVEGALITGTKAYDNGESVAFEAVFVNRTSREGTNANSIRSASSKFGLGFIQYGRSIEDCDPEKAAKTSEKSLAEMASKNEGFTNRVFLEKR